MKLKFKKQAYQTNAVEAVANCFAGQPLNTGFKYDIDPGLVKSGQVLGAKTGCAINNEKSRGNSYRAVNNYPLSGLVMPMPVNG